MSFRTYYEVSGTDVSGLGEQVGAQRARVAARLSLVDRVVVVLSGKGGVGKSYVTAALSVALARRDLAVGVVDADLQSPTIARLLGARATGPLPVDDDAVAPTVGRDGIRVISTDLLLDEGQALRWRSTAGEEHVWRGATETAVLREFLADVEWGVLDTLLVDMPPDAGRLSDLATLVPDISAAIAVTIPTEESERSVARALDAAREVGVPLIGIVENMSGYACGACGEVGPLFDGDAGTRLAAAHGVPLLARLPFSRASLDQVATRLSSVADAVLAPRRRT
ncbi:MAG: antiporter inner rane protein [Gemmatimonadetes bacterium]|nr:antiporter inner rane protein [Gemmatimonadota bacterium]